MAAILSRLDMLIFENYMYINIPYRYLVVSWHQRTHKAISLLTLTGEFWGMFVSSKSDQYYTYHESRLKSTFIHEIMENQINGLMQERRNSIC